jgi:hypothetical protein
MSESYERQRAERILILAQTCDELGSQVAALVQQRDQLLAALEDVWAWAHSDRDWTLDAAVWRQVEAAIAQAKGE